MAFFKNIRKDQWIVILALLVVAFFFYIHYNTVVCSPETFDTGKKGKRGKRGGKPKFVLYYATWCGYSRMFLPVWEEFEQYVKDNMSDEVDVSKIKCEGNNQQKCAKMGVDGFPTCIIYHSNGDEVVFQGKRTVADLIKFAKSHS